MVCDEEFNFAQELIDFIYESPTAFYTVLNLKQILNQNKFIELNEGEKWNLKSGGKYYITKNDSALAAFVVGDGNLEDAGFKIVGAHTDSPSFRIKPNPEMLGENSYIKLDTEVYGGPILNTWLDRPLSIAGRVSLKSKNVLFPDTQFVNIKKPVALIPNLAIHMNREVNSGFELNRQKDMLPIIALVDDKMNKDGYLLNLISHEIGEDIENILDFDLYLYEFNKGCIMGANDEFISSSRLDDLAMVHAGVSAIVHSKVSKSTNVLMCFDNEEVGSLSKQGADSPILLDILQRIAISLGKDKEDFLRAISKSFVISADLAHAVHPNRPEKSDPQNKPTINNGPVIKISASGSYTSDSNSSAVYGQICNMAKVPFQKFVNRSDERGGSTIGPISSSHLGIRSVDMGSPILAMHSIRELGGVKDHTYTEKSFEEFYNL